MGAVPALLALSRSTQDSVQHAAATALQELGMTRMHFLRSLVTHKILKLPLTFYETA